MSWQLFDSPVENTALLFLLGGFTSFLLFCRLRGAFAQESYYTLVGKIHAGFTALTTSGFLTWCYYERVPLTSALATAAVLASLFVLLHHGFFHQVIGVVKKSVSVNLLLKIGQGSCRLDELLSSYGEGRGTDFLVESRIVQMQQLGWVRAEGDHFFVTPSGKKINRLYVGLKDLFGLQTPFEKAGTP